jgi:hypothetical protein
MDWMNYQEIKRFCSEKAAQKFFYRAQKVQIQEYNKRSRKRDWGVVFRIEKES